MGVGVNRPECIDLHATCTQFCLTVVTRLHLDHLNYAVYISRTRLRVSELEGAVYNEPKAITNSCEIPTAAYHN
jgi:hypothetical protein